MQSLVRIQLSPHCPNKEIVIQKDMIKSIKTGEDLVGSFIIASHFVSDPEFTRSVVLITNHNHDNKDSRRGYSGVKINHILHSKHTNGKYRATQGLTLYNGGRIARKIPYLLHSPDMQWSKTRQISPSLCITNIEKNGIDIHSDNMPTEYIIVCGCSVWLPGQLEEEIKNGLWLFSNGYPHMYNSKWCIEVNESGTKQSL